MMRWLTDAGSVRNGKKQIGIAGKSVQKGGLLMLIMLLALLACPISACANELAPAADSQAAGGNDAAAAPDAQAGGTPQDMLLLMQAPIEVMLRQQAAAVQQALAATGLPESGTEPQETPAQVAAAPEAAPAEADAKGKDQGQAAADGQESAGSQQVQEMTQLETAAVNGNDVAGDEERQAESGKVELEDLKSDVQQQTEQAAQKSENAGETERQAEPEQSEAKGTEKSAESSAREAVQPENAPENSDRVESEGSETDPNKGGEVSLSGNEIAGGSEDGKGGETDGDSEADTGRDEDVSLSGNEIPGGSGMDEAKETAGEERMPVPLSANTIPLSGNAAPRTALEDACADLGLSCSGTTITGISNASLLPEKLVIPEGVTYINAYAFLNSAADFKVRELVLADSVTDIASHAFFNNPHLETVIFGKGLHTIGSSVFSGNSNLKYIDFSKCEEMDNSIYNSMIGFGAFGSCPNIESVVLREDMLYNTPANGAFTISKIKQLTIVSQTLDSSKSTKQLADEWCTYKRKAKSDWSMGEPTKAAVILNDGTLVDLTVPLQNQVLSVEYFIKYDGSGLTDYMLLQECFNSNSKMSATIFGLSTDEGSDGVLTYQSYADFVVAMSSQGANSGLDASDQIAMDEIVSRLISGLEFGANEIPPIQVSLVDI